MMEQQDDCFRYRRPRLSINSERMQCSKRIRPLSNRGDCSNSSTNCNSNSSSSSCCSSSSSPNRRVKTNTASNTSANSSSSSSSNNNNNSYNSSNALVIFDTTNTATIKRTADKTNRKPQATTTKGKALSFNSTVHVYEFKTIIGDNPGVSRGCPVALDSTLANKRVLCLWDLERFSERKTREELKLSGKERHRRLHNAGYSKRDILAATVETIKIKKRRMQTNRQQCWDGLHATLESTGRRIKQVIFLRPIRKQSLFRLRSKTKTVSSSSSPPSSATSHVLTTSKDADNIDLCYESGVLLTSSS